MQAFRYLATSSLTYCESTRESNLAMNRSFITEFTLSQQKTTAWQVMSLRRLAYFHILQVLVNPEHHLSIVWQRDRKVQKGPDAVVLYTGNQGNQVEKIQLCCRSLSLRWWGGHSVWTSLPIAHILPETLKPSPRRGREKRFRQQKVYF